MENIVYTSYGYARLMKKTSTHAVVQLEWGAMGYLDNSILSDSIMIMIKSFIGTRKELEYQVEITQTFHNLFEQLCKELELPNPSCIKLLYPMGTLKFVKVTDTPYSLKLPNRAKFIAIVQQWITWNPQMSSSNIQISNNSMTITNQAQVASVALSTQELQQGNNYWEITIEQMASEEDIWIGVASKEKNLSCGPRDDDKMWGYNCTKQVLISGNKFGPKNGEEEYGEPCSTGDVIGVHLSFQGELANLSFTKNGNSLGVAFDDLQGPVYPAVCMLYAQSQVTLSYKN